MPAPAPHLTKPLIKIVARFYYEANILGKRLECAAHKWKHKQAN